MPRWAFTLLNITFISFIQSVLLFSLAAPTYPILLSIQFQPTLGWSDVVFTIFQVGLITTEWFADQQQWGKPKTSTQGTWQDLATDVKQISKMQSRSTRRQARCHRASRKMT